MDFSPPSFRSVGLLKVGFLGHVTKLGFWVSWIPPWEGWRAWTNLGLFEVRWTVQHFLAERPEVITLSWRKCDNPSSLESGVKGQMILFEDFVVVLWLSHVQLFATPWTVACQAPLYMGFSRQEYWSKLPFPSPGYLLDPEIETVSAASPALQADFFFFFLPLSYRGSPGLFWSIWIQCRFCPFCVNVSLGWSPGSVPFGGMQVVWK